MKLNVLGQLLNWMHKIDSSTMTEQSKIYHIRRIKQAFFRSYVLTVGNAVRKCSLDYQNIDNLCVQW